MIWRSAALFAVLNSLAGSAYPKDIRDPEERLTVQISQRDGTMQKDSLQLHRISNVSWSVHYRDGRLTVAAEQTPLTHLLRAVSHEAQVIFKGTEGLKKSFSVHLSRVSLVEGIRILLKGIDHILIWGTSDRGKPRVREVVILAKPTNILVATTATQNSVNDPWVDSQSYAHLRSDPDPSTRRWATERLAEQSDEQSYAALLSSLNDGDAHVRMAALAGVAPRGQDAIEPIHALVQRETDPEVLAEAIRYLGQIGQSEVDEVLGDLIDKGDVGVRLAVIEALGHGSSPTATQILAQATEDPNPAVRMAAITTLAYYVGDETARASVERAVVDVDEGVRDTAKSLVEVFEWPDAAIDGPAVRKEF